MIDEAHLPFLVSANEHRLINAAYQYNQLRSDIKKLFAEWNLGQNTAPVLSIDDLSFNSSWIFSITPRTPTFAVINIGRLF